jgi:hypothetical protein
MVTQLQIGHMLFAHGHLLTGDLVPICNQGHILLTIIHILVECPHHDKEHQIFRHIGMLITSYEMMAITYI